MTTVEVEGIVVVVISVENLDSIDVQPVAGQIVLHPAATVAEGDIPDGDVAALNETYQVRTGDAFVVPRLFSEGPSLSVDGACAVDDHVVHLVGIDQLDGGGLRSERHIVRFHRQIIPDVSTPVERRTLFYIKMYVRLQDERAGLEVACGDDDSSASSLRAAVDGPLNGCGGEYGGVGFGTVVKNVIVGGLQGKGPQKHDGDKDGFLQVHVIPIFYDVTDFFFLVAKIRINPQIAAIC